MTASAKKKLAILNRRAAHLEARIKAALPQDLTYDRAELGAIRWATETIKAQAEKKP